MILHATNKDLIIKESERLISGSVKIYTCEFTFDESWDDFAKTVVFSTGGSRLVNVALLDNVCEIPPEVLRPNARVRIGIYGTDGVRSRPTTYSEWISVEQGADVSGDYAEPPTPSVFDQWVAGIDAKHDAWSANEQARVEAENARVEAEKAREDKETGYVAQAKAFAEAAQASEAASASSKTAAEEAKTTAEVHATSAAQSAAIAQVSADNALNYANNAAYSAAQAKIDEEVAAAVIANADIANAAAAAAKDAQIAAEKARDEAQSVAGGDYASTAYVGRMTYEAETNANAYTDQKIAAIPTPDVSGQITEHNKARDAHTDIRRSIEEHTEGGRNPHGVTAEQVGADPSGTAYSAVSDHNSNGSAHSDIRAAVSSAAGAASAAQSAASNARTVAENASSIASALSRFQSGLGNEYVWAKYGNNQVIKIVEATTATYAGMYTRVSGGTFTIQYADTVEVSGGKVVLVNPTTITGTQEDYAYSYAHQTVGKYVVSILDNNVYKISGSATQWEGSYITQAGYLVSFEYVTEFSFVGYVNSPDPNAYPIGDGYTYKALGQLGNLGAKIATGSYVGTGTYGVSNTNMLTFDFAPKLVWFGFYADTRNNFHPLASASNMEFMASFVFTGMLTTDFLSPVGNSYQYFKKGADGKTVSWYGSDASYQMNNTNFTYYYIAIG